MFSFNRYIPTKYTLTSRSFAKRSLTKLPKVKTLVAMPSVNLKAHALPRQCRWVLLCSAVLPLFLCVSVFPNSVSASVSSENLADNSITRSTEAEWSSINDDNIHSESTRNSDIHEDNARSLLVSSGLDTLIKQIPSSTASSFEDALTVDRLPSVFKDVDQALIRNVVHDAFSLETFDKYMVKELRQGMNDVARAEMLSWYSTELGARVRQAELDNSLLTEQARFEDYQRYINRYPVSDHRKEIIRKLDETLKSTESGIDMMMSIQIAFNLSISPFLPESQRLSRQEIVDMVNQDETSYFDHYQQQTLDVLLFTYQDLTDGDLVQLEAKLATSSGQDFVVAVNAGIKKGMFAASLDLGDGLGALIESPTHNPGI